MFTWPKALWQTMTRIVADLSMAVREDEQRHHHYSRALAWVLFVLIAAMGVVMATMTAAGAPSAERACREAAHAGAAPGAALELPLAADAAALRPLLLYGAPARCVEAQALGQRSVLALDSALFIPAYVLLTLAVLAWMSAVAVHARAADGRRRPLPRAAVVAMLLVIAAVALTAVLDARENRAANAVLQVAMGGGAMDTAQLPALDSLVAAMRTSSLYKWLAAGVWMLGFTVLAYSLRDALAQPAWPAGRARWRRRLAWAMIGAALLATLGLTGGAALGLSGSPASSVAALLRVGFVATSIFPVLVLGMHLLRWRHRIRLHAAAPTPPITVFMSAPPR
jgi:hypothetical protein